MLGERILWKIGKSLSFSVRSPRSLRVWFPMAHRSHFGFMECRWLASNICLSVGTLLEQYGEKLDIIYDDDLQSGNNGYRELIYWDTYEPTPSPSPSVSTTLSSTSSAPLSQSPSSDTTPTNPVDASFPMPIIAIAVISGALVNALLILYFRKRSS